MGTLTCSLDAQKDLGTVVCLRKYLPADAQPRGPIRLLTRAFPSYLLRVSEGAQAWLNSMGVQIELASRLDEINDPPRKS